MDVPAQHSLLDHGAVLGFGEEGLCKAHDVRSHNAPVWGEQALAAQLADFLPKVLASFAPFLSCFKGWQKTRGG